MRRIKRPIKMRPAVGGDSRGQRLMHARGRRVAVAMALCVTFALSAFGIGASSAPAASSSLSLLLSGPGYLVEQEAAPYDYHIARVNAHTGAVEASIDPLQLLDPGFEPDGYDRLVGAVACGPTLWLVDFNSIGGGIFITSVYWITATSMGQVPPTADQDDPLQSAQYLQCAADGSVYIRGLLSDQVVDAQVGGQTTTSLMATGSGVPTQTGYAFLPPVGDTATILADTGQVAGTVTAANPFGLGVNDAAINPTLAYDGQSFYVLTHTYPTGYFRALADQGRGIAVNPASVALSTYCGGVVVGTELSASRPISRFIVDGRVVKTRKRGAIAVLDPSRGLVELAGGVIYHACGSDAGNRVAGSVAIRHGSLIGDAATAVVPD